MDLKIQGFDPQRWIKTDFHGLACLRKGFFHRCLWIITDGLLAQGFFHGLSRISTDGLRKRFFFAAANYQGLACLRKVFSTDVYGLSRMACLRKFFFHGLTRISTDGLRKRVCSSRRISTDIFSLIFADIFRRFTRIISAFICVTLYLRLSARDFYSLQRVFFSLIFADFLRGFTRILALDLISVYLRDALSAFICERFLFTSEGLFLVDFR
jgi:hypothetical protein